VYALQSVHLRVFGWTANNAADWDFMQSLGVDAIYTNDVALGVERQAPIPSSGSPHPSRHPRDHEDLVPANRR
jgi:hypothetical protein